MDISKRISTATTTTASHSSLHRSKRRTRWVIRGVVILLSVAICIHQTYIVSDLYFTYPTNVDVRLDTSPYIYLPAVTICSELPATILVEDLARVAPSVAALFGGRFSKPEVKRLLGRKAVRRQLLAVLQSMPINLQHRFTVSARSFFYECVLPTPVSDPTEGNTHAQQKRIPGSSSAITCEQYAPIVETINDRYKCFSLFLNRTSSMNHQYQNRKPPSFMLSKEHVSHFKFLVWMGIRREFIFNGFIYLHAVHMSHQFTNPKAVQHLDPNQHQSVTVAFEREIIKLLSPPYETNCRDYRYPDPGSRMRAYQCREHCFSECRVRRFLARDGGWPGDTYAEANVTAHFSALWSNVHSAFGHLEEGGGQLAAGSTEEIGKGSASLCKNKECGEGEDDCRRIQYDVRTVRVSERDAEVDEQSEKFTVGVLPPKEVQLVIRHVPKFAFIEFVIYVGGLVNLYLGFSAISLGVLLATYCTCSTKLQTKHVCLPVRRRAKTRARAKVSGDDKFGKSGSRRRLLGGSFLGRSKKSGTTSASSAAAAAAVNGNGQVTPSSASNHFSHNYVPLSREEEEEEKEEAEDVSINL